MNKKLIFRILGAIWVIEAIAMLPAFIIAWHDHSFDFPIMGVCILVLAIPGSFIWFLVHPPQESNLRLKEGYIIVGLGWIALSLGGALPFFISKIYPTFWDALFESVSGFTTTGATVLTDFQGFPRGLMFWRATTHWIGGMGVLVLTLALLPKLTGRTSHLVKAESPGPSLSKLVPHTGSTAKILYLIYIVLTFTEFLALLLCGLSPYDAAIHSLSTAGTGGFSNYGASVGAFNNVYAEAVITVFMFCFGVNFALYYKFLISAPRNKAKAFLGDEEFRWYLCIIFAFIVLTSLFNLPHFHHDFLESVRYSSFGICSIFSTTGFVTTDFNHWPVPSRMLVFIAMFIGACAGSTAGGIKTVRVILLGKISARQIRSTAHPRKVKVVRLDHKAVDESMLSQIAVFAIVYFILVLTGSFMLSLDGNLAPMDHLSGALTCVSNVGPAFGGLASDFSSYGAFGKIICCFLMLAGRLELFPMLMLISGPEWKSR